jgi:hypothetical protein
MKRFLLILLLTLICGTNLYARRHAHPAPRHKAHKATKHHVPKHRGT